MKYLGPFLVGGGITVGAILAMQSSWVPPPEAAAERRDEAERVLLAGELTVPSRSTPVRRAEGAEGEVRRIGVPSTVPDQPAEGGDEPLDAPDAGDETATAGASSPAGEPTPDVAETGSEDAVGALVAALGAEAPLPRARPEEATSEPAPAPEAEAAHQPSVEAETVPAAERIADVFEAAPDPVEPDTAALAAAAAAAAERVAAAPAASDPVGDLAAVFGEEPAELQPPPPVAPDAGSASVSPEATVTADQPGAAGDAEAAARADAASPDAEAPPPAAPAEATPAPAPPAAVVETAPAPEPSEAPAAPVVLAAAPAATAPVDDPSAVAFPRISVLDAGRMRGILGAKAVMVQISGVSALPFAERCDGGGAVWPCGSVARAELARFIGERPVVCREERDVSRNSKVREMVASCSVEGVDLARWLAENGWAAAGGDASPELAAAAAEAERRAVGRHAPAPPPGLN